jgi:secreted PhoX family phosphatase
MTDGNTVIDLETLGAFDADGCARFAAGQQTCRWKCGSQCAHPAPNQTPGDTFQNVMQRYVSRRMLFRGAAAAGVALAAAPLLLDGSAAAQETPAAPAAPSAGALTFRDITQGKQDFVVVPAGYSTDLLIRWGDPLFSDSPPFDPANPSAEAGAKQFGYNCDFLGFMPLPAGSSGATSALLVANHEYTNPEIMFPGYDDESPTQGQVDLELEAHGLAVVELAKSAGAWSYVVPSRYNRRITGTTPIEITGPAAGHAWMQTSADPSGRRVLGTLNNCSAGKTPWGTILSGEENFQQYFANLDMLPDSDPKKAAHRRYGLTAEASERKWETFHRRFDLAQEPNEPFRFGWMVEVDPYDPASTPKKRTALGRTKHEGATFQVGANSRVGVYMGDDERFDYMYKFVTAGRYNPSDAAGNRDLLDAGTLYAARFNDDGTGQWLPLVFGQGQLTEANGFSSQADVLIRTRLAADRVGATKMDRPEDIDFNPVNKKVYAAMTNNTNRTAAQVDKANPRASNRHGHIIEFADAGDNPTATTFTWEIFMLCGSVLGGDQVYAAGYPTRDLAPISSPDNLVVDKAGNLWIFTDGQPGTINVNDSVFAVPTQGPERGHWKPFFNGVPGAEVASGDLSADNETLFVSIQHPGEGGTVEKPISRFPDGTTTPRPSVVAVWKSSTGDKRIGT